MSNTNVLFNSLIMKVLIQLVPIVIIALLAWLILSKIAKRFEKQNEERLALERENFILLSLTVRKPDGTIYAETFTDLSSIQINYSDVTTILSF